MFFFDNNNIQVFEPCSVEHAYLAILKEDLDSAEKVFASLDSPRAKWGTTLISILKSYLTRYPTYFEIRNFFEIDLDFLIKNEKYHYAELLLGSVELIKDYNSEIYKYCARAMYNNAFYNAALEYMEKSKKFFYNDPELHFMFAKYYYKFNNYENAKYYAEECLKILPDYFPAAQLLKALHEKSPFDEK